MLSHQAIHRRRIGQPDIQVLCVKGALFFCRDADDTAGQIIQQEYVSDGVDAFPIEFESCVMVDHYHWFQLLNRFLIKGFAKCHLQVLYLKILSGNTKYHGTERFVSITNQGGSTDAGGNTVGINLPVQQRQILGRQCLNGAGISVSPVFTGIDIDSIGSHRADIADDFVTGTLTDRNDADHRGDPDNDTQHG